MKRGISGGVAITALIGVTMLTTITHGAERLSSPAERAQTAILNSNISSENAAAEERYELLEAQYEQQMNQNEELRAQYQVQNEALQQKYQEMRESYITLEAQYQQQKERNDELQRQIDNLQSRYQEILGRR